MRAFRWLLLVFVISVIVFVPLGMFFSSYHFNNDAKYYPYRVYYHRHIAPLFGNFTRSQKIDDSIEKIRVVDVDKNDGLWIYEFIGKFSRFDPKEGIMYIAKDSGIEYAFHIPYSVDDENGSKVVLNFSSFDTILVMSKISESYDFDTDSNRFNDLWTGRNVLVYWKSNLTVWDQIKNSNPKSIVVVNDPKEIINLIRTAPLHLYEK